MIKSDKVSTLAVTADGKYAISGSVGKTLRVWSLEKLYDIRLKASRTCVVRFSVQYKGRKQDSGNITGRSQKRITGQVPVTVTSMIVRVQALYGLPVK